MIAFISMLNHVWNKVLYKLDILLWRHKLAPTRRTAVPTSATRVLFCDLMTMLASTKVEALIAATMRLDGFMPIVLLERKNSVYEAIFKAAIPDVKFLYFQDYLSRYPENYARDEADKILAMAAGEIDRLINLEQDGVRIGRNVLSMVVRGLRIGKIDIQNSNHREKIAIGISMSLRSIKAAKSIIAEIKPDHAIFNERGYTPAGEVFDACLAAGVDTIQWFGAPRSDSLMYKRYDLANRAEHPIAISDDTWKVLLSSPLSEPRITSVTQKIESNYQVDAFYNRQQLQFGKSIIDANSVRSILRLNPAKKTAVIFAHILYDATFFYGSSIFPDYETWLIESVRLAISNPNLNWVIKVHPVNIWRSRVDRAQMEQLEINCLTKEFGTLPDYVCVMPATTNINTFSLFSVIDYGLTVRGTIGMELPCFGIPVITAGSGRYSGRGFTIDPKTKSEYAEMLTNLHHVQPLPISVMRLAQLHYDAAIFLRPIPMKSFIQEYQPKGTIFSRLGSNVKVISKPDASLRESSDLGRVVDWISSKQGYELFYEPIV